MIDSLVPRSDFPTLESSVYLNQASLGLIGRTAVEAMHGFLDEVARHGNQSMSDEEEVAYFDSLRDRAARLLGAAAPTVAITAGASELLGQLPYLLPVEPGGRILMVASDFPAVTRPWLRSAAHGGGKVCFVDDEPAEDLTTTLIDALGDRTSVLAVSHVQYATGTVVNIPRLRRATREFGAKLIVDASQSAGAIPVDATAWDAEVVVCSGYKWLGGHGGVALAAISAALLEEIPPMPGWMGARQPFDFDATNVNVAPDARRFTQSTMSYVSMAGLTAALGELLSLGVGRVEVHAEALADLLADSLAGTGWRLFREPVDAAASRHIVSLAHPTLSSETAAVELRSRGIVCGTRGGRIRVSLASYNDESDVRALVDTLAAG